MSNAIILAQELLECLRTALNARPEPPPEDRICLRAGGAVAPMLATTTDECCSGLAWVRVVGTTVADGFNISPNCITHMRTLTLEMGVVRCFPTPGASGIVSCDQWTAKALQLDSDYEAMEAALCCAVADARNMMGDPDFVPGEYVPAGPDGNCIGGTLTITVNFACACGSP